ncbi:MAG: hypothetical protein C4K47_05625 [Candidatus Thorarchaeota archaeon]|nr:MAG: hypothetical protein C4K47_05625 [Candidatus Thorarchaeota archaeon]
MPPFVEVTLVRDIVLILDSAVVLYTLLFGLAFVYQWLRSPLRKLTDVRLAWSVFMFGMASNSFCFVMSDFYFTEPTAWVLWVKAGNVSLTLALVGFSLALERILPYHTHHAFSMTGTLVAVASALAPRELLNPIALAAILAAFGILVLFFRFFVRNTTGVVRSSMRIISVAFVVGFVGFLGRSDIVYYGLGPGVYILGSLFLVGALLILGTTLFGSPALDELDWTDQMLELYVIHTSGILLFHRKFVPAVNMNESLTAAGITGVDELFKEIMQSVGGLNNLSIGDFSILFAHEPDFTSVLIAKQPYGVLLEKVRDFSQKFQLVFAKAVHEFSGNTAQFEMANALLEAVFSQGTG